MMILLLCALTLCGAFITLALCQAAANGDRIMAGAFGHDLAEPPPRPSRNRRGHRLGRWLAFHHAVKRV